MKLQAPVKRRGREYVDEKQRAFTEDGAQNRQSGQPLLGWHEGGSDDVQT